jgi:hypothetical protein
MNNAAALTTAAVSRRNVLTATLAGAGMAAAGTLFTSGVNAAGNASAAGATNTGQQNPQTAAKNTTGSGPQGA